MFSQNLIIDLVKYQKKTEFYVKIVEINRICLFPQTNPGPPPPSTDEVVHEKCTLKVEPDKAQIILMSDFIVWIYWYFP